MIISALTVREMEGCWELSAELRPKDGPAKGLGLWFRLPADLGPPSLSADPFLASFLIPCMFMREDLRIEGPVSPRLLRATDTIQEIMLRWQPEFSRISVECEGVRPARPAGAPAETVSYFTAGVDSWFTCLKRADEITRLALIWGYDVRIERREMWEGTLEVNRQGAARAGKPLDTIATNLRDLGDMHRHGWGRRASRRFWPRCYNGAFLAAVGLCLTPRVKRLFIPATLSYDDGEPYGSHPLLDPLWSTEDLDIVHEGAERDRVDKILWLLERDPDSILDARVCFSNKHGAENCGRCEKCLRMMLTLRILGALGQSRSLPRSLDLGRIERVLVRGIFDAYYERLLSLARERGDREAVRAIEIAMERRFNLRREWHELGTWTRAQARSLLTGKPARSVEKRLKGWGLLQPGVELRF